MSTDPSWLRFAWRSVLCHTATYLVAGLLAATLLDYEQWWLTEWMSHYRGFDSPWLAAGSGLQVVRGLILAVVLYPFRKVFLEERLGWLKLWGVLVGVGILSTYAAAPGSVEGVIYTALPPVYHVFGIPEVYGQALAYSLCLVFWSRRPSRIWGWVLGLLTGVALFFALAGALLAPLAESMG